MFAVTANYQLPTTNCQRKKCRSWPISRILSALRRDDHSSRPGITRGLERPTRWPRTGRPSSAVAGACATLFGLAPCGVLPATGVAAGAVRSYRTFSPLPLDSALTHLARGGIFSVPLVLQVTLTGRYPAHCPAEFGLSSPPTPSGARTCVRAKDGFGAAIIWPTATFSIVL